jgi:hypothetical protein
VCSGRPVAAAIRVAQRRREDVADVPLIALAEAVGVSRSTEDLIAATGRIFGRYFPRALDSVGGWLAAQVRAGRIRDLPVPLLIGQLIGPLAVHLLLRPAIDHTPGPDLPSVEETREMFADAFLRAVAAPASRSEDTPCPA